MDEQTFLSLQVKGKVINLYLWVASWVVEPRKTFELRKLGNIRKISKLYRLSTQSFSQNENIVSTKKKLFINK